MKDVSHRIVKYPHDQEDVAYVCYNKELNLQLKSYSQHHISCTIVGSDGGNKWNCCGIYGWPDLENRNKRWYLMDTLNQHMSDSWLCVGDFNETLWHREKRGGRLKSDLRIALFREVLQRCNLHDLGYVGNPFTWSNGRRNNDLVMERLDRAVATRE